MRVCPSCDRPKLDAEFRNESDKICLMCTRERDREYARKSRGAKRTTPKQCEVTAQHGETYLLTLIAGRKPERKDVALAWRERHRSDAFAAMEVLAKTYAELCELELDERTALLSAQIAANARHQYETWRNELV